MKMEPHNMTTDVHFNQEIKVNSRRTKRITSFAIWFCTFSFGLAYNFLSPALVEIKNKYHSNIDEVSKVFTVILLCYLVGALTCGVLFDYLNRQLMVVGLLTLMATGVFVVPYCSTMTVFFVVGGMIGFAAGGYDTAQVVWILEMWQGEAGRFVQSQYFFFALGTLVAPLLIRPFLLVEFEEDTTETTTTTTQSPWGNSTTEESKMYIPLSIGGSIILASAGIILFLYFFDKYEQPRKKNVQKIQTPQEEEQVTDHQVEGTQQPPTKRRWNWNKIILIALSAVVLGCYQGMEICTFQFIPTFAHYVDLKVPEPDAASILSGLTGAFAAGRLLGIFIVVLKVPPVLTLVVNLIISVCGNVILLVYADTNLTLLWVGAILLGLGYSTVFACIYDHIEKHIKVTNKVAATMIIAGGLMSALYPLIVGESVEWTPAVLNYVIFFSLVMCTISFSVLYWLTKDKEPLVVADDRFASPTITTEA